MSNIETFASKYKTRTNEIKVMSNYEDEGIEVSFSVYKLPFDLIEDFRSYSRSINM